MPPAATTTVPRSHLTRPFALDYLLYLMHRMIGIPDHDHRCGFDDREDTLSCWSSHECAV